MKMKIIATHNKPVYPTAMLNSLLSAIRQGRLFGAVNNEFEFRDFADVDNPDGALRGPFHPDYNVVVPLDELDPTAKISKARRAVEVRSKSSTIGYTAIQREMMYRTGVSAMIADWFREFNTLYELALEAESQVKTNASFRLSKFKDVESSDGYIEMYLAAIGELDAGLLNYTEDRPTDVSAIHALVMSKFKPLTQTLEAWGFEQGYNSSKDCVGVGVLPTTQEKIGFLKSYTLKHLGRSSMAAVLKSPRARVLGRLAIMDRIDAARENTSSTSYITITEGGETLVLPAWGTLGSTAYWNQLIQLIDERAALDVGTYTSQWDWIHQFYSMGDLVNGLYSGTIDFEAESGLCVLIREHTAFVTGPPATQRSTEGPVVDTLNLADVNMINPHLVNIIMGTTDFAYDEGHTSPVNGVVNSSLPNGLLDISSPGDMSASDMIVFLRALEFQWSTLSNGILTSTSRARRDIPASSTVKIPAVTPFIADLMQNSIRDGCRLDIQPSFNVAKRFELGQQQGPVLAPLAYDLEPVILGKTNGWGLVDQTVSVAFRSVMGGNVNINALPSIHSGQMVTGRASMWTPKGASPRFDVSDVALNVLSYPQAFENNLQLRDGLVDENAGVGLKYAGGMNLVNFANQSQYQGLTEHNHPQLGFMKGWFHAAGVDPAMTTKIGLLHRMDWGYYQRQAGVSRTSIIGSSSVDVDDLLPGGGYIGPAAVSTADALLGFTIADRPHHTGWIWDASRAQIIGTGWYRYNGEYDTGGKLDPYVQGAISVLSPFVRLAELNGDTQAVERQFQIIHLNGSSTSSHTFVTSEKQYHSLAQGAIHIEEGYSLASQVLPIGPPEVVPSHCLTTALPMAYLAGDMGGLIDATDSVFTDVGHAGTAPAGASTAQLPAYLREFSLNNHMSKTSSTLFGGYGVNRTNGQNVSCVDVVDEGISCWNGETALATSNLANAGSGHVVYGGIVISGEGLHPDYDSDRFGLSPAAWFRSLVQDTDLRGSTFLLEGFRSIMQLGLPTSVSRPQANLTPANAALNRGIIQIQKQPVLIAKDDWFSQESSAAGNSVLPPPTLIARRLSELVNPWIKMSPADAGLSSLQYEPVMLDAQLTAFNAMLVDEGKKMVAGLTDELFRALQHNN
jgi:hypothetical protein